ncbi:hypothetical protein [Neisseria wadsworthii]|uniref:Uncharacterized protein n=1 Tax=Neisseria wadsworthii 9715 TaxID=1030841 RepID=G4CPG2_9NEIS|nr:hypothetical protein [Neisseria wadsworthii]EGZ47902.1 hypothetical protein HMPREF9370_0983 [Neisseria wadsworthii 9715]QMT34789.1 hypothetical protein H3L96_06785 [Neisseria wadsworthii]
MKLSAKDFMSQQQRATKNSKLEPLKNDILLLHSSGYTLAQILNFLSLNNVQISKTALHHFIKTRYMVPAKSEPAAERGQQKNSTNAVASDNKLPVGGETKISEYLQNEKDKNGSPRKFDWQNPPSREKLFGSPEKQHSEET